MLTKHGLQCMIMYALAAPLFTAQTTIIIEGIGETTAGTFGRRFRLTQDVHLGQPGRMRAHPG